SCCSQGKGKVGNAGSQAPSLDGQGKDLQTLGKAQSSKVQILPGTCSLPPEFSGAEVS
ncbi:Hypothetical predicted protein, partial [Marmota monax]